LKTIESLPVANTNRFEQLDYIAQDNPLAAICQDEQIEHQVDMLIQHPQMGRPGRKKGTRVLVISRTPFVVVCRVRCTRIEIVRLLHSSQQRAGHGVMPKSVGRV
jgi:toxin ParE1/3/4